jgi:hypothetical protein
MVISENLARRFRIGARLLAGTAGVYAVTWLVAAALAVLLPLRRDDAVLVATNLAFLVAVALVLWVFCARRLIFVLGFMAVVAGLCWSVVHWGAR